MKAQSVKRTVDGARPAPIVTGWFKRILAVVLLCCAVATAGLAEPALIQVDTQLHPEKPLFERALFNMDVRIWEARADSRRVYVKAFARMRADELGEMRKAYQHTDGDVFIGNERRNPDAGIPVDQGDYRVAVLTLTPTASLEAKVLGLLPDSRGDYSAYPLKRLDVDDGPMDTGDGRTYYTVINSDASSYCYGSMLYKPEADRTLVDLAITVGSLQEESFSMTHFQKSERKVVRLSIPVEQDIRPPLTIQIGQEFPDILATVDSITFTFTPLATYYDVKWHWTSGYKSPHFVGLAFALADKNGRLIQPGMPISGTDPFFEQENGFEGSLAPGELPAEMQLHWQQGPVRGYFFPCPEPIRFRME